MGWSFCHIWTKKNLTEYLTKDWSTKDQESEKPWYIKATHIAHCYRGNNFSGVLWSVWETQRLSREDDTPIKDAEKWIACHLLRCEGGDWGYKDMEESMSPCYYSCPLGYLDMAPVANEGWREKVREYHNKRKLSFKPQSGMVLKMRKGVNPQYIKITSLRPFRGQDQSGNFWRIPKKYVEKQVECFPA